MSPFQSSLFHDPAPGGPSSGGPFSGGLLFKGSARDLFTPQQIQQLMRVEFDRSRRHGHPLVMLLIAVDRLAQLQDLYGADLRDNVLRAVAGLVRTSSRASDALGCMLDDRLLILTPHTPADGAASLAKRILEGVRAMSFDGLGRTTRVTISIGGAHSQTGRMEMAFDTLLDVAEGGLKVARESGGNRYVHSDLYEFFEERRKREQRERERLAPPAAIPAAGGPVLAPPPVQPPAQAPVAALGAQSEHEHGQPPLLGAKIRELFGLGAGENELLARIQQEVVASALREMKAEIERALGERQSEHRREIDTLERRIQKLTKSLGMTDAELKRALSQQSVDPGVASIYTSVQGLSSNDVQHELKKELMSKIFQANLELRKQIAPGTSDGA